MLLGSSEKFINQFLFNIRYSSTKNKIKFLCLIVVQSDTNIFLQYKNSIAIENYGEFYFLWQLVYFNKANLFLCVAPQMVINEMIGKMFQCFNSFKVWNDVNWCLEDRLQFQSKVLVSNFKHLWTW